MPLRISIRQLSDVNVVDLDGRLVIGPDTEALTAKLQELSRQGARKILVNLSKVTQLDSSGICSLLQGYTTMKRSGGSFKLLHPGGHTREAPALLKVFARVKNPPDLIFCDGHGYAHPRRFGITSHLGLLLETPTIGCAKSLLIGTHEPLPREAGAWVPLEDKNEVVGAVLRTRKDVKPIYVTQGHRVSLQTALKFVLAVLDGYRIPRPTRDADHFVAAVKRREC